MDEVLKFKESDGIFFANVQTLSPTFYCHQTLNLLAQLENYAKSMNAKVTFNYGDFFSNRNLLFLNLVVFHGM